MHTALLVFQKIRRLLGRPGFYGDYRSFADAAAHSIGYKVPALGFAPMPFQSMHVDPRTQQVLAALCRVLNGTPLSVLDVGGADGDYYYRLHGHVPISSWTVLETPEMVRAMTACDGVKFVSEIPARSFDLILMSGVLQYLPDPYSDLRKLSDRGRYILINRLPLVERARITVQRLGPVSYPAWFFDSSKFLAAAAKIGTILMQWKVPQDNPRLDGRRVEFSGMLIERH